MNSNEVQKPSSSNRYVQVKLLGEGSFENMTDDEKREAYFEAKIHETLDHPNIIKFKDVFICRTPKAILHIVMDYADNGDLQSKIKAQKGKFFNETQILDMFTQICLAIKHIHDRKILHRDLKSQNIFMSKNGLIKLGDFGIAKCLNLTLDKAKTVVGTPYYLSPEIVQNKPYNFKSDIWSLGVLLYEMVALKMPFDATSLPMLSLKIIRGGFTPIPGGFSRDIKTLISQMLQVDSNKRPSITELLRQPVVKSRIKNFLGELEYNKEFSHTILHKYNVLKPGSQPQPMTTPTQEKKEQIQTNLNANANREEKINTPNNPSSRKVTSDSRDRDRDDKISTPSTSNQQKPIIIDKNLNRQIEKIDKKIENLVKVSNNNQNPTPYHQKINPVFVNPTSMYVNVSVPEKKPESRQVQRKSENKGNNNNQPQVYNSENKTKIDKDKKEISEFVKNKDKKNSNNQDDKNNNIQMNIQVVNKDHNLLNDLIKNSREKIRKNKNPDVIWIGGINEYLEQKSEPSTTHSNSGNTNINTTSNTQITSPRNINTNNTFNTPNNNIKQKEKEKLKREDPIIADEYQNDQDDELDLQDTINVHKMQIEMEKLLLEDEDKQDDEEEEEYEDNTYSNRNRHNQKSNSNDNKDNSLTDILNSDKQFILDEETENTEKREVNIYDYINPEDEASEYSQLEEIRVKLEDELGIKLMKRTTENNLSCDVDFLKGVIVENLSQEKAYSIENITEAVNRIPEFFSIVMHEKMLNIN